jgi:hypothetical protein
VGFLGVLGRAVKPAGSPMIAAVTLKYERWWALLGMRLWASVHRCHAQLSTLLCVCDSLFVAT